MDAAAIRQVHLLAHARIDQLFTSLLDAAESAAPTLPDLFRSLREEIITHIESEEEHALPRYEKAFPEEAGRILAEHKDVRAKLASIGQAIEQGTFKPRAATELRVAFSLHEAREETTIYPWYAEQAAAVGPSA